MSEEKKTTQEPTPEVATVSLQARIPQFWRENPRLWFAQFEAVVAAHKLGEEQKYNLVIPVLERVDIEQISDIIIKPPSTGKFTVLKNRLISVYQESENRQIQKLLSGLELGDQKPTQLLRKMRDLGGTMFQDDALKVMWMGHLPAQARAVLSVNNESSLDGLAAMADKMMEHTESTIAVVSTTKNIDSTIASAQYDFLTKQIEKLSLEIAELRSSRTPYRRPFHSQHRRSRSRSKTPADMKRKPGDANWECYYHHRYGDKARRCTSPCSRKKSEN